MTVYVFYGVNSECQNSKLEVLKWANKQKDIFQRLINFLPEGAECFNVKVQIS